MCVSAAAGLKSFNPVPGGNDRERGRFRVRISIPARLRAAVTHTWLSEVRGQPQLDRQPHP